VHVACNYAMAVMHMYADVENVFLFDCLVSVVFFFFSSRRRHTRCYRDWSSDVCSSDLADLLDDPGEHSYVPPGPPPRRSGREPSVSRSTSASIRRSSPTARAVIGPRRIADFSSRPGPPTTGGAVRPPSSSGATHSATRSTTPASRNDACTP